MSQKAVAKIIVYIGVAVIVALSLGGGIGLRGVIDKLRGKEVKPPQPSQVEPLASPQLQVSEAEKSIEVKQLEQEIDASNEKIFELLEEYKR